MKDPREYVLSHTDGNYFSSLQIIVNIRIKNCRRILYLQYYTCAQCAYIL